jgi:hypothetical protein
LAKFIGVGSHRQIYDIPMIAGAMPGVETVETHQERTGPPLNESSVESLWTGKPFGVLLKSDNNAMQ